jgi:hypothetical protein
MRIKHPFDAARLDCLFSICSNPPRGLFFQTANLPAKPNAIDARRSLGGWGFADEAERY